jgi:DNA-nicking Smr family endonuclease
VSRRRILSAEERALWRQVTETIEPLERRARRRRKEVLAAEPPPADLASPAEPAVAAPTSSPGRAPTTPKKHAPPAAPPLTPLAPIDRHERRRLARGTRSIDSRIDLHGLRQSEAHQVLRGFLAEAQRRNFSIVLVITGKGAEGPPGLMGEERGVLRRVVPQWLRLPDLRPLVAGFEEAHAGHGGAGALYVRLRRARRGAP